MTWGNRNPQPKENDMGLINKMEQMFADSIAAAKNDGFVRGVKWQKNLLTDDEISKARNEGFAEGIKWADMNTKAKAEGVELTVYHIDAKTVTKEEYERHLRNLNPTYEDLDPAPEHNDATCGCCPDLPTIIPEDYYYDEIMEDMYPEPGENE